MSKQKWYPWRPSRTNQVHVLVSVTMSKGKNNEANRQRVAEAVATAALNAMPSADIEPLIDEVDVDGRDVRLP
jgi:hypothetical protein